MRRRAVVLLSGGLDSTATLALAIQQGVTCYPLFVDYGQKNKTQEYTATRRIAAHYELPLHVLPVPLSLFAPSGLTSGKGDLSTEAGAIVEGRNVLLVAIALAEAARLGCDELHLGLLVGGFPDATESALAAYQDLGLLCFTKPIHVFAPWIKCTKAEMVEHCERLELRVPWKKTYSCYQPGPKPCGKCMACQLRSEALLPKRS